MKSKSSFVLLMLFSAGIISAQTATTVNNGNWTNPFTWSCTCVPTPGYTVTINHNVTLNTSFAYTSGGITINAGGSLIQDTPTRDIWVNGGSFSNSGSVDVRFMLVQAGAFSNSGTMTMRAMANYLAFTNSGTIQNVDSLYLTGAVTNNGGFINIDSITTAGSFFNNGVSSFNQFTNTGQYVNNNLLTFTDITNTGTMLNNDTITALNSGWNLGFWSMVSNSYFLVNNGFLNDDNVFHDAVFENNGRMNVLDSWYNFDTIKGISGSFLVQDSTVNYGSMLQSFDFCDLTPPSSAPFIDFNFGSVASGITWCVNTSVTENAMGSLDIYPNPATTQLYVIARGNAALEIDILDLNGKVVRSAYNVQFISVIGLPPGMYFVRVVNEQSTVIKKIEITD